VFGSRSWSLATVVPLPVPLRPHSTRTHPVSAALPTCATMTSHTSSGVLPSTSIVTYGAAPASAGRTPASMEIWIPARSFTASSSSRPTISAASLLLSRRKSSSALR